MSAFDYLANVNVLKVFAEVFVVHVEMLPIVLPKIHLLSEVDGSLIRRGASVAFSVQSLERIAELKDKFAVREVEDVLYGIREILN